MRRLALAIVATVLALSAADAEILQITGPGGAVQAVIDLSSVTRDNDGNAHARVCVYRDGVCPPGWMQRWFFNCRDHSYSGIDTTVLPQFPHDMNQAEPGSVADRLAAAACR